MQKKTDVTATQSKNPTKSLNKLRKDKKRSKSDLKSLKKEIDISEHKLSIQELCVKLSTNSETGLTEKLADKLLNENGPNMLTPPKETPEIIKFLRQMTSGFSLLLWIGAALSIIAFIIQITSDPTSPYDSK